MIWTGIMLDGRTPIFVFGQAFETSRRCREYILVNYDRLFRDSLGNYFILMYNIARPDLASLVDKRLESADIRLMG